MSQKLDRILDGLPVRSAATALTQPIPPDRPPVWYTSRTAASIVADWPGYLT